MSELKELKFWRYFIMMEFMSNETLAKDFVQLFRAVIKPHKRLREILKTDEVNVWLYIRKNHLAYDDLENITSDIMDYCYKYRYNIRGVTIAENSCAFSKIAIPFIMDNANVNCILSPSASNLTRNFKDFNDYIRVLKSRGIYFETLDSGVVEV